MTWITEHIAIGSFRDAEMLRREVSAVLCLRPGCVCEHRDDVDALFLPLVDGPGNDREHVDEAVEFIAQVVGEGERILVHCHAGRSRSVAIVARYLIKHRGLSRKDALEAISSRREVALTPGIEDILGDW